MFYVHDEFVFQLPLDLVAPFITKALPILQDFPQISVPIRVDCELFEHNWKDKVPIVVEANGTPVPTKTVTDENGATVTKVKPHYIIKEGSDVLEKVS